MLSIPIVFYIEIEKESYSEGWAIFYYFQIKHIFIILFKQRDTET